jgi:hypothetical protein
MSALLLALALHAAHVDGDVAITGGGGGTGDSYGYGPLIAGRVRVRSADTDLGFAGSAWTRLVWWPGFELFLEVEGEFSARFATGRFSVGVDHQLRNARYAPNGDTYGIIRPVLNVGPSVAMTILDAERVWLEAKLSWLPVSDVPDIVRTQLSIDFSYGLFTARAFGGVAQVGLIRQVPLFVQPHFGLYLGVHFTWG